MMFDLLVPSVPVYVVDLAFAVLFLAIGAAAGWWLIQNMTSGSGKDENESERMLSALTRVSQLASSVAHDVGEHTSRVREITTALNDESQDGKLGLDSILVGTVAQVVEANERLQAQLRTAEERLKQQAAEIHSHATDARTDALTRLHNRRAFDAELESRFAEWKRLQSPFSLFMVDVDHFKKFNDTYGHQAGDEVLMGVARILCEAMREMDVVCRYGGEEFAVILPATEVEVAKQAAARARAAIEAARFRFDGTELNVTASIGMAEILVGEDNATLVKRADTALYDSKKGGRNCAHYHDGTKSHLIQVPAAVRIAPQACHAAQAINSEHRNANRQTASRTADTTDGYAETKVLESLPDQKAFIDELRRRVAESQRFKVPLSLMLVHVDNFRTIATQFGAPVGDLVLDAVGQYLQVLIRDMDLLARYNNGQFCIMLPGSSMASTSQVAERIRNAVSSCVIPIRESKLQLTICLGVAEMLPTDETSTLLERAKEALHAARAIGPNQSQAHDGQQCRSLINQTETSAEIRVRQSTECLC